MPNLFGQHISSEELSKRVGHLTQVGGVRMMELKDGLESGVRIADVRTGSGLRYQVSLDRGMDISIAEYKGMPLAWRSANGDVHPSHFDPRGLGWARSFPGGLMTGCGMSYLGAPCVDDSQELGLHGRLSNLPAFDVSSSSEWKGETCTLRIEGFAREWQMFRENLLLHRTIESQIGDSAIVLHDIVRNEADQTSPLMMLYHINAGWPLVDAGAMLLVHERGMKPRDAQAEEGAQTARMLTAPIAGYKEQVFYHDLIADADGLATVCLVNRRIELALAVRFRQQELPRFIQWKMMGEGTYVLGMEPANCGVEGRAKERERGTLQFLEPGEERHFEIEIGVLASKEEIYRFATQHNLS